MGAEGSNQKGGLHFSRLQLADELLKSFARINPSSSHILRGFEANKDNFLQNIKPSIKKYDEIVFYTHGYFGKDLPDHGACACADPCSSGDRRLPQYDRSDGFGYER